MRVKEKLARELYQRIKYHLPKNHEEAFVEAYLSGFEKNRGLSLHSYLTSIEKGATTYETGHAISTLGEDASENL